MNYMLKGNSYLYILFMQQLVYFITVLVLRNQYQNFGGKLAKVGGVFN